MKYMAIWSYEPAQMQAITERFQATGGLPPEGVTMLGRWFDVAGGRGLLVAETDDLIAITRWTREWSDLMDFDVFPVLDDESMMKALQD